MKKFVLALMCAMLLFGLPQSVFADDQALHQLSKDTDFVIYAPQLPKTDWKLDIPVPYPFKPGEKKLPLPGLVTLTCLEIFIYWESNNIRRTVTRLPSPLQASI